MKYAEFQDLPVFINVRIVIFKKKTHRLQCKIMRYTVVRVYAYKEIYVGRYTTHSISFADQ